MDRRSVMMMAALGVAAAVLPPAKAEAQPNAVSPGPGFAPAAPAGSAGAPVMLFQDEFNAPRARRQIRRGGSSCLSVRSSGILSSGISRTTWVDT